jgi:predicted permease
MAKERVMPILDRLKSYARGLWQGSALDRELDAELASALEELAERKQAAGMETEAARRAARLELGGAEQVKERVRESRAGAPLAGLLADVRVAWRGLRRAPGFAAAVILTLALGVGANTAIFTMVNAVLLQPLPYRQPDRLAFIWADHAQAGYPRAPLAGPELADLRERATRLEALGAIWANTVTLTGDGDPEQLRIGLATANFFSVLGADAALGRTFATEDEAPNAAASILLSWSLWQRRYGADPAIVGRRILVNGAPATVIGVMPETFRLWFPADANVPADLQAWRPFSTRILTGPRGQQFLRVVARLRPGVSLGEANREVAEVGRRIGREHPEYGQAPPSFYAVSLQADGVRAIRPALLTLFAGVTVLLVIACVNVANLLVARAAARQPETSLRVALGASRLRLTRQFLVEGLVLSALGLAAGLVVAEAGLALLLALRPESLARLADARTDGRVLAFAASVTLAWGTVFSLAPLPDVFRRDVVAGLRRGGRGGGTGLHHRLRSGLVLAQVGLGVVLLVASGLLVRSFLNLQQVDLGFRAGDSITFRVSLPFARLRTPAAVAEFSRQLERQIVRVPGVARVGGVSHLPYDNLPNWSTPYLLEGERDLSLAREADARAVTPGFFSAIGAQLLEGRTFTETDDLSHPPVAVVDERLAARLWPGQSAVGGRILADPPSSGTASTLVTIVGVVRHIRHRALAEEVREQVYFPERQVLRTPLAFVVAADIAPAELTSALRRAVAALDPELPVYDVRPLRDYVSQAMGVNRFTMLLALAFAAVALVLAAVGVFGVLSYAVARRRHELAIRLALGAGRKGAVGLVLREALVLGAAGIVGGLAVAGLAAPLVRSQLFGVTPFDPLVYAVAVPILAAAIVAAALVPARRATGVNALDALRVE